MSNEKNTGGPAFPMRDPTYETWIPGMTLRDYFAAKAMQGILSSPHVAPDGLSNPENIAHAAYEMADTMLKASEQ